MENNSLKSMTIEEFNKLPEDNSKKIELIDGELLMQARPSIRHQNIMSNLHYAIKHYLKDKPCKVLTEVELEINNNVIVPDISVLCNIDNLDGQRFKQPPIIVIEILSPSNTTKEINNKVYKYKIHGIQECWLIDPEIRTIEVKNLIDNTGITFIQSGLIKSDVLSDINLEVADIFD